MSSQLRLTQELSPKEQRNISERVVLFQAACLLARKQSNAGHLEPKVPIAWHRHQKS